MATYTETKATLDEIARRTTANKKRRVNYRNDATTTQSDLAAMQTAYTTILNELDTQAAANPDDAAWQTAAAEKAQMVSDFQALKALVDADVTALG